MVERKTIRPTKEVYDLLNSNRKEAGDSWDDYLMKLYGGEGVEVTVQLSNAQADEIATSAGNTAAEEIKEALLRNGRL